MNTPDELSEAELATLTRTLRELEAALSAELEAGRSREATVDLDQTAVGRVSRIDAIQQQKMAQAEARRRELRLEQVQRALVAVEEGEYGQCRRCDEPIGVRRLTARPETPFCVPCATSLGA